MTGSNVLTFPPDPQDGSPIDLQVVRLLAKPYVSRVCGSARPVHAMATRLLATTTTALEAICTERSVQCAGVLGLHLEGPYINDEKFNAQRGFAHLV